LHDKAQLIRKKEKASGQVLAVSNREVTGVLPKKWMGEAELDLTGARVPGQLIEKLTELDVTMGRGRYGHFTRLVGIRLPVDLNRMVSFRKKNIDFIF